jgi:hypothetical protein
MPGWYYPMFENQMNLGILYFHSSGMRFFTMAYLQGSTDKLLEDEY